MIALDTNLLVYAADTGSRDHARAREAVAEVVQSPAWALPWSVVHEYLRVLTAQRIAGGQVSLETAIRSIDAYLAAPGVHTLTEPPGYWRAFRDVLTVSGVSGSRIFDARIAATCLANGVSELWTADRGFSRFPGLKVRNPLVT